VSGKGKLTIIAFLAVALLSAGGLLELFALRFERGDVFPPYSTLRSDPLGCKALFQALEASAGLEVARNFHDPDKLKGSAGRTIYWLGADETLLEASPDKKAGDLEALAREGNRLVIAFGQEGAKRAPARKPGEKPSDKDAKCPPAPGALPARGATGAAGAVGAAGAWGVRAGFFEKPAGGLKGRPQAALCSPAFELPETIPLQSRRYFQGYGREWNPVYSFENQAVVLERTVGKGSLVLLADPYLFSNEALRKDRSPGLFAWLQGESPRALFDESHLGVYENSGVTALIKKLHLVPFVLALLALAALHLWKSAVPFSAAPAEQGEPEGELRDNFSGLVNLLRRNIAPGELLNTCLGQWLKSFSREAGNAPGLIARLQKALDDEKARPAGKRDPVALYKTMAGLLSGFRMR
jgi:hypothetical protein